MKDRQQKYKYRPRRLRQRRGDEIVCQFCPLSCGLAFCTSLSFATLPWLRLTLSRVSSIPRSSQLLRDRGRLPRVGGDPLCWRPEAPLPIPEFRKVRSASLARPAVSAQQRRRPCRPPVHSKGITKGTDQPREDIVALGNMDNF
jgi:hypothetical protein